MNIRHFYQRPTWQWLILLMGVALVLRLIHAGRDSLWFDEAVSYLAATLPFSSILNNTVQSSHPPLYYLVLRFWLPLAPDSDAALRMPGIVWNVLLIPAIYLLTQALFKQRALGLLAGALVAISPFHILYSHELRMYTQLMLLVTLGAWAYWRARETADWRYGITFGFLFALAVYTHLFAFLVLAGIGLHALLYGQDRRAFWRTAVVVAAVSLLFLPWLALMVAETQKDLGSLRPLSSQSEYNPIKPLTSFVFLLFGMSDSYVYSGLVLFTSLALIAILLMEIRRIRQEGIPSGLTLAALLALLTLAAPSIVYLFRPFFLPERTMAAASPFLLILLAWCATRRGTPLPYLVGVAALTMLAGSLLYLTGEPIKPLYREVIQYVAEHSQPTDVVLHSSDGSYLPALRYVELPQHVLLAGDPDPRKPVTVYRAVGGDVWTREEVAQAGQRVWLIVALEHSVEWQLEQATYFAEHYRELQFHQFGGSVVYLYQIK